MASPVNVWPVKNHPIKKMPRLAWGRGYARRSSSLWVAALDLHQACRGVFDSGDLKAGSCCGLHDGGALNASQVSLLAGAWPMQQASSKAPRWPVP